MSIVGWVVLTFLSPWIFYGGVCIWAHFSLAPLKRRKKELQTKIAELNARLPPKV